MPRISAHAKINLSLEVTGKRPDGYHELVSVMQEVTLADEIQIGIARDLSLTADADCGPLGDNLVLRAAQLLLERRSGPAGAVVQLHKRIPIGAGLGGGSSDAAATLVALNRMWQVGETCSGLKALAANLGSDVPFFLTGGSALVEGRGERVTALPDGHQSWYLLTNPEFQVSTREIFERLRRHHWSDGSRTRRLADRLAGRGTAEVGTNSLQQSLFELYPRARDCFAAAAKWAPGRTIVTGSGPTVLSLFDRRADAVQAEEDLASLGYWTCVVRNCPAEGRDLPCRA